MTHTHFMHWTETATDSLSLAQAFLFDHDPMKGLAVARERAERFATRCAGGPGMFWACLAQYMGKAEVARIRGAQ